MRRKDLYTMHSLSCFVDRRVGALRVAELVRAPVHMLVRAAQPADHRSATRLLTEELHQLPAIRSYLHGTGQV